MRPRPSFTREQKAAIGTYNEENKSNLSLHYSHCRVEYLNTNVFSPLGVALLPLPGRGQISKSKVDRRYIDNLMAPKKKMEGGLDSVMKELVSTAVREEISLLKDELVMMEKRLERVIKKASIEGNQGRRSHA
jgi:hypothetical protein